MHKASFKGYYSGFNCHRCELVKKGVEAVENLKGSFTGFSFCDDLSSPSA